MRSLTVATSIGEKTPAFDDDVWELYDTEKDWSQANDLSKQMPEKLHELQRLWLIEATPTTCCRWTTISRGGLTPTSRAVRYKISKALEKFGQVTVTKVEP